MPETFPKVASLVPHRGSMLLIDSVEAFVSGSLTCRAVVRTDNPFMEDGFLANHSLVEYVAQAAACHAGLRARDSGTDGTMEGFLVQVRSVELADLSIRPGDALRVEVEQDGDTADFEVYTGRVETGGRLACSARIGIYHPTGSRGGGR